MLLLFFDATIKRETFVKYESESLFCCLSNDNRLCNFTAGKNKTLLCILKGFVSPVLLQIVLALETF